MNKQQVFYVHGGDAFTDYHAFIHELKTREVRNLPNVEQPKKWTDTFVEDLGEEFEVFTPQMPNAMNAKYEEWKLWFERHFEYLHDGIILVGWSLGAMFFVRYITENTLPFTVRHLFLLAGAYENIDKGKSKEDGGDFFADISCIPTLQSKVQGISILHSKDDFVVSYEHACLFNKALPEAELVTFDDKNHFLVEEFPELLEKIRGFSNL